MSLVRVHKNAKEAFVIMMEESATFLEGTNFTSMHFTQNFLGAVFAPKD